MDWRGRKYYAARFSSRSYSMRIEIIKNIDGVSIHPLSPMDYNVTMNDEAEPRGYYHILIGCPVGTHEVVEYELNKAVRNDERLSSWKEIKKRRVR